MSGYVKIFDSLLDSTVWETPQATRIVWITMLVMADRDGYVGASVPGLAKRAGVERGECERALAVFLAPDPDSRTKEHEGKRIVVADGGWTLLNYEKYRDRASFEEKRAKDAARQRRKYERDKARLAALPLTHLTREAHAPHEPSPILASQSQSHPQSQLSEESDARVFAVPAEQHPEDYPPLAIARQTLEAGYKRRLASRTATALPKTPKTNEAFATIARWCAETSVLRGLPPGEFAERLLTAFFESAKATESGFKLSWLAQNPAEFLAPPKKINAEPVHESRRIVQIPEDL